MKETFLTEFQKRGYFNQCTNYPVLDDLMSKSKIKAYIGFDCTAPSLHVGILPHFRGPFLAIVLMTR